MIDPTRERLAIPVIGPLAVDFPDMCIKCGRQPVEKVPVSKLFRRTLSDSTPDTYLVEGVLAPVCGECERAHLRERRPIEPEEKRKLLRLWFFEILPFLIPVAGSLFFLRVVIPVALKMLFEPHKAWEMLFMAGIVAFFLLLAISYLSMIRSRGNQLILHGRKGLTDVGLDHYVDVEKGPLGCTFIVPTAPTSVSSAIDFSDDRSELFDGERHLFRFENADVAARFSELNANRQWNPASPRAKTALTARRVVIAAFIVFGLYELLRSALKF